MLNTHPTPAMSAQWHSFVQPSIPGKRVLIHELFLSDSSTASAGVAGIRKKGSARK